MKGLSQIRASSRKYFWYEAWRREMGPVRSTALNGFLIAAGMESAMLLFVVSGCRLIGQRILDLGREAEGGEAEKDCRVGFSCCAVVLVRFMPGGGPGNKE